MEEQKLLKRRSKALRENNEQLLISVCTDLANLYMEQGRHGFAIEEYTTVANLYKKQKMSLEYAIVNRGIGEAYLGLQKFDKALNYQKLYLETVKENKNKLEEQRALATIGHTFLSSYLDNPEPDRSNLELANKFFKKSLVASQSLNGQVSKLEIADMSARLFANLGLVQDCMGNYNSASELINKSINLCKTHDLYEQLQRGYTSLASLLVKIGDYKMALQQYNLAVEAAKNLRNKPIILSGILLNKSEVLVKLGDFHGAKNTLNRAYKLKISDEKESKRIEKNLRTVVTMCYTEDKLLVTEATDYVSLKKLYEKMGDACCDLKLYSRAIEYYKKMLDAAVASSCTDNELSSCYYSLAETYKDNNEFDEAVKFFEKELELCKTLKDSLNTLSNLADTKEASDAAAVEVQTVYQKAIELCQNDQNRHEEGRMVKRFILYLRRQKLHSEAFNWEQVLMKLDFHSSDSDSEITEAQSSSVVEAEIDLDVITDVSEDSDLEQMSMDKPRKRNKNFQVKRNVKGESQLHTACIKGQLNVVSHLLEQGHPVNVRDNCGWLPLHEACIHGYLEVVKVLLEKGAAINDRGGTQCEGITPLHDAASNGHLPIVELLLSKGANPLAKTDDGDTILDFLNKWHSTAILDQESQNLYEAIIEQISKALERAGHKNENQVQKKLISPNQQAPRYSALIGLIDEDFDSQIQSQPKLVTPTKNLRRSVLIDLDKEENANSIHDAASNYRDVIEKLRHKNVGSLRGLSITKRPALLSSEDYIEDWLEDDIGKSVKKRKTVSPIKTPTFDENSIDFEMIDTFQLSPNKTRPPSPKARPLKITRKKQSKLTSFGHTRSFVEADSTVSPRNSFEASPKKNLPRTSSFDTSSVMEQTLSVDVRINKKLYRVPILLSEVNTRTIKWLADEAATRYARKEYIIPTLELETKNGAILANDDPICLLFPMGATQAEEVEGRIVKCDVPPIIDRFREACQDMNIACQEDLCKSLQELSVNLNLANRGLKGKYLAPLCKILSRQTNLIELNLSGNFLTNECFDLLFTSITSLENLYKLNLNCTGLQSSHLEILKNNLLPDVVYKLNDLDLSDNYISDQSFETLAILTRRFQLTRFNLSSNKLEDFCNSNFTLNLETVEEFDISDNQVSNQGLLKILSEINHRKLTSLNVSRNNITEGFVQGVVDQWEEDCGLHTSKLSRCQVNDSELFEFLRISKKLKCLDLSYNDHLTSISLRRLLESDIRNINLYGCRNITKYFTDFAKYLDGTSSDINEGKTLKISLPENSYTESEYLIKLWREMYGYRSIVELSSKMLYLSLEK